MEKDEKQQEDRWFASRPVTCSTAAAGAGAERYSQRKNSLEVNGKPTNLNCAKCPHDWGQHGGKSPHICCVAKCECQSFSDFD